MKAKASQDYGFLIDQLDIKRNQLESDGKLSPGDYDLLRSGYQKVRSHPGMSPAQRSNIDVKISQLEQEKRTNTLSEASDVNRMNREINNDNKKIVIGYGNDPQTFLQGKLGVTEAKIFRLQEIISNLEQAGSDSSQQQMELLKTYDEWQDEKSALQSSQDYVQGQSPQSDFTLNIETNSHGEIRNLEISRGGPKSGFLATNGVLGGFSVAGKVNTVVGAQKDKNIFRLGDKTFSGSVNLRPGPEGTFEQDTLVDESQQQRISIKGAPRAISEYSYLDPVNVKTQRYSRPGEWIQSGSAFYKQLDNGQYEKYIGATKKQLNINDDDLMSNLPDELMDGVISKTVKTYDSSKSFSMPISPSVAPATSTVPVIPVEPQTFTPAPTGTSRTPSSTVRSPQTIGGYAQKALGVGKGILDYLFGGGK